MNEKFNQKSPKKWNQINAENNEKTLRKNP
jgi:hypothetical protein